MIANTLSAKTILTRPPYILFFLGAHPFQIVGVFLYAVFALPYIVISRDPAACLWHILAIALLTGIRSDALHRSWHAFLIPDYRLTQRVRTLLLALALSLPIVAVVFEPDRWASALAVTLFLIGLVWLVLTLARAATLLLLYAAILVVATGTSITLVLPVSTAVTVSMTLAGTMMILAWYHIEANRELGPARPSMLLEERGLESTRSQLLPSIRTSTTARSLGGHWLPSLNRYAWPQLIFLTILVFLLDRTFSGAVKTGGHSGPAVTVFIAVLPVMFGMRWRDNELDVLWLATAQQSIKRFLITIIVSNTARATVSAAVIGLPLLLTRPDPAALAVNVLSMILGIASVQLARPGWIGTIVLMTTVLIVVQNTAWHLPYMGLAWLGANCYYLWRTESQGMFLGVPRYAKHIA